MKLLLLVAILAFSQLATAASEQRDVKHYGNCVVTTQVDLLTDEERPLLLCAEFADTQIAISQRNTGLAVLLKAGIQFHPHDFIPVAIRVYPAPVIRRSATWVHESAIVYDHQLADSLLVQLAAGQKLVLKVGTESGVIDLTGSAQAVRDFRQRLQRHPQSLEAPHSQ